jgi:hypothetical protein
MENLVFFKRSPQTSPVEGGKVLRTHPKQHEKAPQTTHPPNRGASGQRAAKERKLAKVMRWSLEQEKTLKQADFCS